MPGSASTSGVVVACLQLGQHLERGARQLRPEEQRLQARDQRVAAEDGHEPRHPGRGHPAGAAGAAHPQRGEVGDRLEERAVELVPVRPHLRHAQLPGRERLAHARQLLAEAPLGRARRDRVAVDRGEDVEAQLPALARAELEPVDDLVILDLTALGEDHLRPRGALAVWLLEHELVVLLLVPRRDRLRQRLGARGVAEREVVRLDREDVREVGPELERELEGDRLHRLVLDDHVVLHAVADEAVPDDRERVLRQAAGERVAQEEGGREVLDLARREQQRRGAVDGQAEPREEARVVGEQAVRLAGDVAALVADAEGRAFEDRQRHQASRRIRAGLDCARALTTSSSTFTCGGRVSAKSTHSATSSGVMASTFA